MFSHAMKKHEETQHMTDSVTGDGQAPRTWAPGLVVIQKTLWQSPWRTVLRIVSGW